MDSVTTENNMIDTNLINPANKNIGLDLLSNYFKILAKDSSLIVSVGSGTGYVELFLEENLNITITCIDPNPTSFQKGSVKKVPNYSSVKDLINEHPDIIGKVNLFINWPSPEKSGRFDLETIKLLKPRLCLCVIDTTGGAGSDLFLNYLKHKVPNIGKYLCDGDFSWVRKLNTDEVKIIESIDIYYIMCDTVLPIIRGSDRINQRYLVLVRHDVYDENYVQTLPRKLLEKHEDCIIC
jgi:SAM-dependent methyltransferase